MREEELTQLTFLLRQFVFEGQFIYNKNDFVVVQASSL